MLRHGVTFCMLVSTCLTVTLVSCAQPLRLPVLDGARSVRYGSAPAKAAGARRKAAGARRQVGRWSRLRDGLSLFRQDLGRFPNAVEGLEILVQLPLRSVGMEDEGWNGPYVHHAELFDPWGNRSRYCFPGVKNPPGAKTEYVMESESAIRLIDGGWSISPDGTRFALYPDVLDLWSVGPDGVDGTDDDIGNWDLYRFTRTNLNP